MPGPPLDIMVVSQSRVVSRMATTALDTFGCREIAMTDPIKALGMAVRMPPDLVVASAIMTSLERTDSRLRCLPADTTVLRLGPRFADDLRNMVRGLTGRR